MIPSSEQLKGDFVWAYKKACELWSWETVVERNSRSYPGDFFLRFYKFGGRHKWMHFGRMSG
jgi:hypothetical protein